MTLRDRHGLMSRIRQIRRAAAAAESRPAASRPEPATSRVDALEARIKHLERLVEGLQDSVYRESERHGRMIAEIAIKGIELFTRRCAYCAGDAQIGVLLAGTHFHR